MDQGEFCAMDLYVRQSSVPGELWEWFVLMDICEPWQFQRTRWIYPYRYPRHIAGTQVYVRRGRSRM